MRRGGPKASGTKQSAHPAVASGTLFSEPASLADHVTRAKRGAAWVGYIVGRAGGTTNDLDSVMLRVESGNTNALGEWLADRSVMRVES